MKRFLHLLRRLFDKPESDQSERQSFGDWPFLPFAKAEDARLEAWE